MRNLLVVLVLALSGCATVNKMETGNQNIGERMTLTLDGAWNHVALPGQGPAQTWTMEGLPVDVLLIYSGLKDGEAIHRAPSSGQKSFNFRASMQPDEIVGLFEGVAQAAAHRSFEIASQASLPINASFTSYVDRPILGLAL